MNVNLSAPLIVLAVAISVICLIFLFPHEYLLGIGLYWENPALEVNVALAALRYYVSENQWFPLGHIRNINVPEGINILYGSAVPLFAFFGKVTNQILGININTIYVWSMFSNILQGASFAYIFIALGIRKISIISLVAVMGMIMPSYIWRLENAVPLPLFLISLSLGYYFVISGKGKTSSEIRRTFVLFALMVAISFSLNVYITAMIIPIFLASLLRANFSNRISILYCAGAIFCVAFGMAVIAYGFGYFYGGDLVTAAGGFDFFSMNLIAPFDLGNSSIYKLIDPNILPANATGGQQEGMQYLGLGWLFLILYSVFVNRHKLGEAFRHHYILIITLLAMALFSLSNKIYVGNLLLLEWPMPNFLSGLVGTFRAPGRFFWPMGYLLVAAAVLVIVRKKPNAAPFILCGAIALQIVDTHELRQSLWNITSGLNEEGMPDDKYVSPYGVAGVPSTAMEYIIKNHSAIRQYPSWWCDGIGNQLDEIEISYIASRYLISQNSFYTARAQKDCYAEDLEARKISTLDPDTLYIFSKRYTIPGRLYSQGVDLSACWNIKNYIPETSLYFCSAKILSKSIDITTGVPQWWKGGLVPVEPVNYVGTPVVTNVSASGSFDEVLYRPENVMDYRIKDVIGRFPDFWLSPNFEDGWINLDLEGSYMLSEVRLLNTNNAGIGDRAAGVVKLELYEGDGSIVYTDEVEVLGFPEWTSLKIDPPILTQAVKLFVAKREFNGAGLNEVRLIGAKRHRE